MKREAPESEHCLRCGAYWIDVADLTGIDALCWPPGSANYYRRHTFSLRGLRRREKKDEAKLAAWKEATTSKGGTHDREARTQ